MKIHEYQGKELLRGLGVPVPLSRVAFTPDEAGPAHRRLGDNRAALEILEPLAQSQPNSAATHLELGLALANAHRGDDAILALRRAVKLKPDLPDAWRILGDHLTLLGETADADAAYAQHIRHSTRDPRLLEPAAALCEGRIAEAEHLLRNHLREYPTDVAAIRMLAEVGARLGRYGDAEKLLSRCLELAPGFLAARHNRAVVLQKQAKLAAAVAEVDLLLVADPGNPGYRNLAASLAARLGDMTRAIGIYAEVLREFPRQAKLWMSYGHTLKTAGRLDEAIAAYRRCLDLAPQLGESDASDPRGGAHEMARDEVLVQGSHQFFRRRGCEPDVLIDSMRSGR